MNVLYVLILKKRSIRFTIVTSYLQNNFYFWQQYSNFLTYSPPIKAFFIFLIRHRTLSVTLYDKHILKKKERERHFPKKFNVKKKCKYFVYMHEHLKIIIPFNFRNVGMYKHFTNLISKSHNLNNMCFNAKTKHEFVQFLI